MVSRKYWLVVYFPWIKLYTNAGMRSERSFLGRRRKEMTNMQDIIDNQGLNSGIVNFASGY